MKTPARFIVIDDDDVNNMVCKIVIKTVTGQSEIKTFINPELAFRYIIKEYSGENEIPTVLFLDINMPIWSGWDFLENFEKLDEKIKNQIKIYMLSSSIDSNDIARARSNPNVVDYISKPLTHEIVSKIMTD